MLAAEFIIVASTVVGIEYSVHNPTANDIYVFDRVFTRAASGEPVIDAGLAYRRLQDGTLVVEKVLQPIPPGLKVGIPDIPYMTRVAPGETRQGRINFKAPVTEYGAYYDGPHDGKLHQVAQVVLRIGYIDAADIGPGMGVIRPDPHHTRDGFVANYGLANRLQKFFEVNLGAPPASLVVSRRN
jgi:hypothetical protein